MGLFRSKPMGGGILDVIRCDEPEYLVWKWHPEGTTKGNNAKENSIRWGSRLNVKSGSVAVFAYKHSDGTQYEYIEGPFDKVLETQNFPVLSKIQSFIFNGNTPFPAEVYFINLAKIIQISFAVPFFNVFDPRFSDYSVPIAVRGTITFRISNYVDFIYLHTLYDFSLEDFKKQVKDAVVKYVKSVVSNAPDEYGIPVIQIERKIEEISETVEDKVKTRLYKEFGVTVSSMDISDIEIDKQSDGYKKLKEVTQDITTATVKAQADVNIKKIYIEVE